MKNGLRVIFALALGFAVSASARPEVNRRLLAAQDVQTAVAVAAYNKREALKAYRDDIFAFLQRCDNPNPSAGEVAALAESFREMDAVFTETTKSMFFVLKFRVGARRAGRSFHDVSEIRKNALDYFHSIQADVNVGDFVGCKAKFEFAMAEIDPEVLYEIRFGEFSGEPVSLFAGE